MKIQRLSTSSFKLYSNNGRIIMIDPWLTNDPLWPLSERIPEKLGEIDIIAITHAHFDHASGIDEIMKYNKNVFLIAQYEFAFSYINKGFKNVIPASFGATADCMGIKFSPVPASHTSSQMDADGNMHIVGIAAGYVIEFEKGIKLYVSGDTGLTADMKFVVGDYHKPLISILPATGFVLMEPEQAAYAANMTGCKYAIPYHDFPKSISEAANPEGYAEFLKNDPFGVLDSYKKIDKFMEVLKRDYLHIKGVYIPIGESVEI